MWSNLWTVILFTRRINTDFGNDNILSPKFFLKVSTSLSTSSSIVYNANNYESRNKTTYANCIMQCITINEEKKCFIVK